MDEALNNWLNSIVIIPEGEKPTIQRTLDQVKMDGLYSIYDFAQISYIAKTWLYLIDILPLGNKKTIVNVLMQLYDLDQISLDLFIITINNLA